MNIQVILDTLVQQAPTTSDKGSVASYIPELAKVDPNKFGMALMQADGTLFHAGDSMESFSIQSISKVFTLALALPRIQERIWERVGVEPSGHPFNDVSLLEIEKGIPRNPLINAGALVICDMLLSCFPDPKASLLEFVRDLAQDTTITYDEKVATSERRTGHKNRATAHLIKSFGNLEHSVDEVLDLYFQSCSLALDCVQLCKAFSFLMRGGVGMDGKSYLDPRQAKRINAIMLTCGFYDEAGEFAFEVGLPGKSGVGGGIAAVLPQRFCAVSWSPGLNPKGNSQLGLMALEKLTTETGLSIF